MKIKIINIALFLITVFGTLLGLSYMPDRVPVHFNGAGIADRWGSKYELLIMPVIMAVMLGIWLICDRIYGKKAETATDEKARAEALSNIKVINITFTSISALFLVLTAGVMYMSYSQLDSAAAEIDIMKIVTVAMGITFVIFGNFMPKSRLNSLVGFRLPWTMYNDVTWAKSNRFAGYVMIIAGLITAISGIILGGMTSVIVMMIVLFASIIPMMIYAYLVYTDEKKKTEK